MKTKNLIIPAIAALIFTVAGNKAMAVTVTDQLDVTATVEQGCSVSTTADVSFGTYNPASTLPDEDGAGSFSFKCTTGTAYEVYIARNNQMLNGGNILTYELYTNIGRTTPWPVDTTANSVTGTGDFTDVSMNVYGRIAAGQDVPAGAYSEATFITVEY